MSWTMTMNRKASLCVGVRSRRRPGRGTGVTVAVGVLASLVVAGDAGAQVFSTLHAFSGQDGSSPSAALVQGPDDTFYGTTQLGGQNGLGTVFGMTSDGAVTTVYEFTGPEGSDVFAPILIGRDGRLYGTTALGGPGGLDGKGAVFAFSPGGLYTALHFFSGSDGKIPQSGLVEGKDGSLYGTTASGGEGGNGTVFAITPRGDFHTVHAFAGCDGGMPLGNLVVGRDGWFYGTTVSGGAENGGTVFRISLYGEFSVLHSFGFDPPAGNSPRGGLTLGTDGDLYGTTEFGGEYGNGEVFRLSPDGTYTPLHSFVRSEGTNPLAGLILANDGTLYGTASSGGAFDSGSVFAITGAGDLSVLHAFTGDADGGSPVSAVVQARDGRIYGTTPLGGAGAVGTVFRIAMPGPATTTTSVPVHNGYATVEDVVLNLPSTATALRLTITARRTPGLRWARPFQTAFRRMSQVCRVGARSVVCTFDLRPGALLSPGSYTFAVQSGAGRRAHDVHMDTFDMTYTSGGQVYEQAGRF
jgi:uncharacterized repeat protein (TIGR03803 family)